MQRHKWQLVLAFFVSLLLLTPPPTGAMTMLHYDLASLVFLSTDIVIADISESADHKFTATAVESLYGAVRPGDHLDTLTPFLSFFRPMETGIRVVLFLDRRPHQYDFFHSDAAKSAFAVPPSGVYLVDEYDHVHEYYQPNNPGPYVAQHYSYFFEQTVPSKEINGFGGWYSRTDGQFNFAPDSIANIPAGDYSFFLKSIPTDDKSSTSSCALNISIRDTPSGKTISPASPSKN